jgi:hypothetical protein
LPNVCASQAVNRDGNGTDRPKTPSTPNLAGEVLAEPSGTESLHEIHDFIRRRNRVRRSDDLPFAMALLVVVMIPASPLLHLWDSFWPWSLLAICLAPFGAMFLCAVWMARLGRRLRLICPHCGRRLDDLRGGGLVIAAGHCMGCRGAILPATSRERRVRWEVLRMEASRPVKLDGLPAGLRKHPLFAALCRDAAFARRWFAVVQALLLASVVAWAGWAGWLRELAESQPASFRRLHGLFMPPEWLPLPAQVRLRFSLGLLFAAPLPLLAGLVWVWSSLRDAARLKGWPHCAACGEPFRGWSGRIALATDHCGACGAALSPELIPPASEEGGVLLPGGHRLE